MDRSNRFDLSKETIDEAFSLDVGKCIDVSMESTDRDGNKDMAMKYKICRISEATIEVIGDITHSGGDIQNIKARYSRNVPIEIEE